MSTAGAFIYVNYPRTVNIEFHTKYYLETHMALVDKHWGPFGMKSWSIVQFPEGDPSGLHTQAIMHWDSVAAFEKALAANIPEIMEDVHNYSNVMPTRYCGQVMKQG